jgi:hypothetical protein
MIRTHGGDSDNTGHKCSITMRIGGLLPDLAERARGRSDPVMARLGPVDLVLARIRERRASLTSSRPSSDGVVRGRQRALAL